MNIEILLARLEDYQNAKKTHDEMMSSYKGNRWHIDGEEYSRKVKNSRADVEMALNDIIDYRINEIRK